MIVLASASPRRKELLSFITTDFKVVPADIDETVENNLPLEKRPEYLAVKKALHISKNGYEKSVVTRKFLLTAKSSANLRTGRMPRIC